MKLEPLGCRVIVEMISEDGSPILRPDNIKADEIPSDRRWRVIAVGEDRILDNGERIPIPLKIGDEVAVHPRMATLLEPRSQFGGRLLLVVEMGGALIKIEREAGEPIHTYVPTALSVPRNKVLVPN